MTMLPSFQEDHISQIPALQLLQNLGYTYLTPAEANDLRNNKKSNVILDVILENQLRKINRIYTKGRYHDFSDNNIKNAIIDLKSVPFDGLVRTSEKIYEMLTLGKSYEQNIEGDNKSYSIKYFDWENIHNNVFHVTEEFEVERADSDRNCRPDVILFVNGIPLAVIECKRPDLTEPPIKQAISQHLRNQHEDHIPQLFLYSSLLMAVSSNEAMYATTGTAMEFWSKWEEESPEVEVLINTPLSNDKKDKMFGERFNYVRRYFDALEAAGNRTVTQQDKTIYSLCRPERLLEMAYQYIVFDANEKKITRYQQYFAIKDTVDRIKHLDNEGKRNGGVIWHTQGSVWQ
ncbi:type I restriction endonuclease subunit R [bacterium]|nr:MAG: type I restriction endonuclease subunit R [bacterium]